MKVYKKMLLLKAIRESNAEQLADIFSMLYLYGYISIPDVFLDPMNLRLIEINKEIAKCRTLKK